MTGTTVRPLEKAEVARVSERDAVQRRHALGAQPRRGRDFGLRIPDGLSRESHMQWALSALASEGHPFAQPVPLRKNWQFAIEKQLISSVQASLST